MLISNIHCIFPLVAVAMASPFSSVSAVTIPDKTISVVMSSRTFAENGTPGSSTSFHFITTKRPSISVSQLSLTTSAFFAATTASIAQGTDGRFGLPQLACPAMICKDYMNACGVRYGGCHDTCFGNIEYSDPGCPTHGSVVYH